MIFKKSKKIVLLEYPDWNIKSSLMDSNGCTFIRKGIINSLSFPMFTAKPNLIKESIDKIKPTHRNLRFIWEEKKLFIFIFFIKNK